MSVENPDFWRKIGQIPTSRRSMLKAIASGTAGLAALTIAGCNESDTAKFSFNIAAGTPRVPTITDRFKDAPESEILILPPVDTANKPNLDNVWRVGGARIEMSTNNANEENVHRGKLRILLDEQYKENPETLKAAFIVNNEYYLTVRNIRFKNAQDSLDDDLVHEEDLNKIVIEVDFEDYDERFTTEDLINDTPTQLYFEIGENKRVFQIEPLSKQFRQ